MFLVAIVILMAIQVFDLRDKKKQNQPISGPIFNIILLAFATFAAWLS